MTVLSDCDIKTALDNKEIDIYPLSDDQIGPASVDLTLGNLFKELNRSEIRCLDPKKGIGSDCFNLIKKHRDDPYIIHPGGFVLAITKEKIKLPADLIARLDGRSSWARYGIIIHSTAGFINPGYEGKITLEITNISNVPVCIRSGARVCQIIFERLITPSKVHYGKRKSSKYIDQKNPLITRIND